MQRKTSLPVSRPDDSSLDNGTPPLSALRRRVSSISTRIQPPASPATSWAPRRTKSVSSTIGSGTAGGAGESIRKWWEWGWSWILSRKPVFAQDLEMNEEETKALGLPTRGSWRHVLYKVRSEIRRMIQPDHAGGLPRTCRYDSFSCRNNFEQPRTVAVY